MGPLAASSLSRASLVGALGRPGACPAWHECGTSGGRRRSPTGAILAVAGARVRGAVRARARRARRRARSRALCASIIGRLRLRAARRDHGRRRGALRGHGPRASARSTTPTATTRCPATGARGRRRARPATARPTPPGRTSGAPTTTTATPSAATPTTTAARELVGLRALLREARRAVQQRLLERRPDGLRRGLRGAARRDRARAHARDHRPHGGSRLRVPVRRAQRVLLGHLRLQRRHRRLGDRRGPAQRRDPRHGRSRALRRPRARRRLRHARPTTATRPTTTAPCTRTPGSRTTPTT